MHPFDPVRDIGNSAAILDAAGRWPNFHDAAVTDISLNCGDVRPEDDVWIGPIVRIRFLLTAMRENYPVILTFHDCEEVSISGFNQGNDILDLEFRYEDRGFLLDQHTPLTPHIRVRIVPASGLEMEFLCFRIAAERGAEQTA